MLMLYSRFDCFTLKFSNKYRPSLKNTTSKMTVPVFESQNFAIFSKIKIDPKILPHYIYSEHIPFFMCIFFFDFKLYRNITIAIITLPKCKKIFECELQEINSTYEYTNHYILYPLSLTFHINHNGYLIAYRCSVCACSK